jgi:hypothetical protein
MHLNIKFNVCLKNMNLIVTLKILFVLNLVYLRMHAFLLKKVKTVILFLMIQKMLYAL